MHITLKTIALLVAAALSASTVTAGPSHSEQLNRADLSGDKPMEVISSISEYRPGDRLERHFHKGLEVAYVVQGASIQAPGKAPGQLAEGRSLLNLRDIPHGGFTIVGEQALKVFTVHIVDKGQPIYHWLDTSKP